MFSFDGRMPTTKSVAKWFFLLSLLVPFSFWLGI